ncbi:MAG: DedA family protein [Holosporales bacterium]|jgi:membrane protein DedA with SNARE-associated domain|nr:DedA family protein [Holosporales bacterium]
MLSGLANFVKDWGYIAVMLGAMIEGESVVLTASALSAMGYMSIYKVFFIVFLTTVITDQGLFFIGYKMGTSWLINKFPKLEKTRNRVFKLLHKMDIFFIFSFRFIYGVRTISPLIIGSAHIKPRRFIIYNFFSGVCWAFVSCFLGYTITDYVMDREFNTMPAVVAITGLVIIFSVCLGLFLKFREKKINQQK